MIEPASSTTNPGSATNSGAIANLSPQRRQLLLRLLAQEAKRNQPQAAASIPPALRNGSLPLSFSQQRMWFLNQIEPDSTAYNVPFAVRLSGALNESALEYSLNEIIRRHEVLRTRFIDADGTPEQVILPSLQLPLPVTDLRGLPESVRASEIEAQSRQVADKPFNLASDPLLRVRLLRLTEQEYILLLGAHHIVWDGWSVGVFIREAAAHYQAFLLGQPAALPEPGIQYADYAVWQRRQLTGEVLAGHLEYWKRKLAGASPLIELPFDGAPLADQRLTGASLDFTLDAETAQALHAICQQAGATLFMTLLAAFKTLLYRYSGQRDLSVGTPIANRQRQEVENLIGCFINTLVLRTEIVTEQSFRALLADVKNTVLEAFDHQELPFEKLVEEHQPQRDSQTSPLFRVLFSLQNAPQREAQLPGLRLQGLPIGEENARFDLSLSFSENADGTLNGSFQYAAELFEVTTIERMIRHFRNLLSGIAANPDCRLTTLPLADEKELHQIVNEWNQTSVPYSQDCGVQDLFTAQAGQRPDATAIIGQREQVSYGELNDRVNRLANYLRTAGIGPEQRVGILLERSVNMIAAALAVLKAGGAYLPLDPAIPRERQEFMLGDAGCSLLLTDSSFESKLPAFHGIPVFLDTLDLSNESAAEPVKLTTHHNSAYVIYTSGSTGKPKGVVIEHGGLTNYIEAAAEAYKITSTDRALQFANFSFDFSAEQIYTCLIRGGALVLLTEEMIAMPEQFLRDCDRLGITMFSLPTAYWHELVASLSAEQWAAAANLRLVIIAGERALPERVKQWKHSAGRRLPLINFYGPTETTVGITLCYLTGPDAVRSQSREVPIGRPMNNCTVYILDPCGYPQPVGIYGEIYLGGAGIGRCYLNRPDLTAERFVPCPFSATPGARLYRTGDLAKYLPDGNIEYLGRIDHQVKLRGHRIELGEIESALAGHPNIQAAAVITQEAGRGDVLLSAYLTAKTPPGPTATELRDYLKQWLPGYMVPSFFIILEAMPLTISGKIDRQALSAIRKHITESAIVSNIRRTPTEEIIAGIWADVLTREQIAANENFFEIGGHSLTATQIIGRVRKAFGIELPLRSLFEGPTISALAKDVEDALREQAGLPSGPLPRAERLQTAPLSFGQQRLWVLDQIQPGTAFYNISIAVRLVGKLDLRAFKQAFSEIIRRHEILRTVFADCDGQPMQVVTAPEEIDLPVADLSSHPPQQSEETARRLIEQEAQRPFDLKRGPLLRVGLIRLAEEEHVATLTMHHIVSDGWSIALLIEELAALYTAFVSQQPSPLPELKLQYADFASWQRERLQGKVLDTELAYWRKQLAGMPAALNLPTDFPRPAEQTFRGAVESFQLSAEITDALRALSRSRNATLFMTLLAGFKMLLSHASGQTDVVVGTGVAGRNRVETEGLIGFFLNNLVLRTDVSGDPAFDELLERVRETALGAYAHQDLPFEKLVESLRPARDPSRNPLFQVWFILQNTPSASLKLPGLELRAIPSAHETSRFDLSAGIEETERGLEGWLEYNRDLFTDVTIKRMVRQYVALLQRVAETPAIKLSELRAQWQADEQQAYQQTTRVKMRQIKRQPAKDGALKDEQSQ